MSCRTIAPSLLDIRDAERAQGLQSGHTAVDSAEPGDTDGVRTKRFELVGNALPGEVHRLPVKCISCHMQKQPLRWSADIACECAGSGGAGPSMAAHARLPASAAVVRLCCASAQTAVSPCTSSTTASKSETFPRHGYVQEGMY